MAPLNEIRLNRFFISEYFPARKTSASPGLVTLESLNRFFISEYFPANV